MKRTLTLLALSFLLIAGCGFGKDDEDTTESSQTSQTVTQQTNEETETEDAQLATKEKSCKDSGGTYKNGTCTCPKDTYGSNNTPIYTYNAKTGYCEDPDGVPGGILGKDGKGGL